MNKTIKTVMMLGAVSALAACGGISWQKSDFEGVKAVAAGLEDNIDSVLDFENLKFGYTVYNSFKETAKGVFSDNEVTEATYEFDTVNLKLHIKESYSVDYKSEIVPTENEKEETSEEIWYSYNEKSGIIGQRNDGESKIYTYVMTKEELDQYAEEEGVTAKEYAKYFFIEGAEALINLSTIYSPFASLSAVDSPEEIVGDEDGATYNNSFYVAKEGDLKFSIEQKYSYDNGYENGYKVDVTYLVKGELNKWLVKEYVDSYKEVGEYYVTDTELTDYEYESTTKVSCTKKVSISIPSLKGYTEVVAD